MATSVYPTDPPCCQFCGEPIPRHVSPSGRARPLSSWHAQRYCSPRCAHLSRRRFDIDQARDERLSGVRARYVRLKEEGLCVKCGALPATKESVFCIDCLERRRTQRRQPALVGYAARHRKKLADAGVCAQCGKRPPVPGLMECATCRAEKDAQRKTPRARAVRRGRYQRWYTGLRADVFAHYGGRCACCGEDNQMFLCMDHIDNDGHIRRKTQHPRSGDQLYSWIIKNNFPDFFQILCVNCNYGKHRNGGVCPHKEEYLIMPFE